MAARKPIVSIAGVKQELPAGDYVAGAREVLTAARTYYVATTGSDSNDGLTVGAPFLTIQKAVDVVCSLDMSMYQVTIQVADGTYTQGALLYPTVGQLAPRLQGNSTTPASCLISVTAANCIDVYPMASWNVQGFKVQTATSGMGLRAAGVCAFGFMDFGACASYHILSGVGGSISTTGNYTISGGSQSHVYANNTGYINVSGRTITIINTPAFSISFAQASTLAALFIYTITWSGTATGKRYSIVFNSVVQTWGMTTTWLPGDVDGTTSTGGVYG